MPNIKKIKIQGVISDIEDTYARGELSSKADDIVEYEVQSIVGGLSSISKGVSVPVVCGQPIVLIGTTTSAPAEANIPSNWIQFNPTTGEGYMWNGQPSFVGQIYVTSNGKIYISEKTSSGTLSWVNYTYSYSLPTASSSTKGGVKVGTGLKMSSDTMSIDTINTIGSGVLGKPADSTIVDEMDNLKFDKLNIATSFGATTLDTKVPSEKLVKNSLDGKVGTSDIVTSFNTTASDTKVPSEKLVKNSLSSKFDKYYISSSFSGSHDNSYVPGEQLVRTSLAGKLNSPTTGASSGKVLGLDSDLNPVWEDNHKRFYEIADVSTFSSSVPTGIDEALQNGMIPIINLSNEIYYFAAKQGSGTSSRYSFQSVEISPEGNITIKVYWCNYIDTAWHLHTKYLG